MCFNPDSKYMSGGAVFDASYQPPSPLPPAILLAPNL